MCSTHSKGSLSPVSCRASWAAPETQAGPPSAISRAPAPRDHAFEAAVIFQLKKYRATGLCVLLLALRGHLCFCSVVLVLTRGSSPLSSPRLQKASLLPSLQALSLPQLSLPGLPWALPCPCRILARQLLLLGPHGPFAASGGRVRGYEGSPPAPGVHAGLEATAVGRGGTGPDTRKAPCCVYHTSQRSLDSWQPQRAHSSLAKLVWSAPRQGNKAPLKQAW